MRPTRAPYSGEAVERRSARRSHVSSRS